MDEKLAQREVVRTWCQASRPGGVSSRQKHPYSHTHTSINTGVAGTARACERFVRDKAVETDLVEVGFLWVCLWVAKESVG